MSDIATLEQIISKWGLERSSRSFNVEHHDKCFISDEGSDLFYEAVIRVYCDDQSICFVGNTGKYIRESYNTKETAYHIALCKFIAWIHKYY